MLNGIKNVNYVGNVFVEEISQELPLFILEDIPAEEWNRRARIQNTKMFIQEHKRLPFDYEEVKAWVYSFIPKIKESHSAGNTMTFEEISL